MDFDWSTTCGLLVSEGRDRTEHKTREMRFFVLVLAVCVGAVCAGGLRGEVRAQIMRFCLGACPSADAGVSDTILGVDVCIPKDATVDATSGVVTLEGATIYTPGQKGNKCMTMPEMPTFPGFTMPADPTWPDPGLTIADDAGGADVPPGVHDADDAGDPTWPDPGLTMPTMPEVARV
jgi:hypothetical protein